MCEIIINDDPITSVLDNSQPNPPHTNGGTMSNERTVSFGGEVSRIFRWSSAQPSSSIYNSNASFTSTVSNDITTSASTAAQQGPSNSTNSTLTPCLRLSHKFNNSRAGQTLARKGKQTRMFPGKEHGYGLWKMAMLLRLLLLSDIQTGSNFCPGHPGLAKIRYMWFSIGCSVILIAGYEPFFDRKMPNCYRVLDLFWQDNILAKTRSKMTTVSRFSRQNDAGLRALNFALWENLVLVVVLVLGSKGP